MRNEKTDLLRGLRAVRRFEGRPIPEVDLTEILEVARWTGTASNQQAWKVVVVRDRATLDALSECGVQHLAQAAVGLVIVSPGTIPELEAFDEGRISERMMLAALAQGIASGVGWFKDGGRARARELIGAPSASAVRTAVSLGYAAPGAELGRRRRPLAEFVSERSYS